MPVTAVGEPTGVTMDLHLCLQETTVHARPARWTLAIAAALLLPRLARAQNQTQVTVSGVGYLQYVYQLKDTANHLNQFDVTRAYVNLIGKFAGGVGARVTLDARPPPAGAAHA